MSTKKNPATIPFRQVITVSVAMAAAVQFIIITYNIITGYILVNSGVTFMFRWIYGTVLSTIMGLMVIYPDLLLIRMLNRNTPWGVNNIFRVILEISGAVVIASAAAVAGTTTAYFISPYTNDLLHVLVINAMILSVINISVMIGLEAWIFWRESRLSKLEAARLELQLAKSRFEILKNQINPHFLFNSLNVLSGLVYSDPTRAELFIDEFSRIYRYVLETIEKPAAPLEDELAFARSYIYLQQIRYGEGLIFNIRVDSVYLHRMIPSLALQVVLENAIRHNVISQQTPLVIDLSSGSEAIIIRNTMNLKLSGKPSTGIGQKNLTDRYALAGSPLPTFIQENSTYVATLPLLTI